MHPRYEDREYVNMSKKVRRITFTQSPHSLSLLRMPHPHRQYILQYTMALKADSPLRKHAYSNI